MYSDSKLFTMPISKFRGQYFFLSNFYPCENGVEYEGDIYPTSEHAYQAAKIEDQSGRDSFTCEGSVGDNPLDAKKKGGKVKMRGGWDKMKAKVMLEVCRSKFARDAALAESLICTGNHKLVEGHTGDKFWGGKANHLGNILMRIREELKETQSESSEAAAPQKKSQPAPQKQNKKQKKRKKHA